MILGLSIINPKHYLNHTREGSKKLSMNTKPHPATIHLTHDIWVIK
jgi:hypothetical protein